MSIPLQQSFSSTLPKHFYARVEASPVRSPALIKLNIELAKQLGLNLDEMTEDQLASLFSGNDLPGNAESIAQAYAGHQFGSFNPSLGDGRALLLGDVCSSDNLSYDVQLKGSGPTPYSRGGDGRSAIGPVIREYIVSEAMYKLGVPTTRALAAVASGEPVYRQNVTPGGVFTRVARSHIRVGTFEYFRYHHSIDDLRLLADFTINRLYPEVIHSENPYKSFFHEVVIGQAELIAKWDQLGFVHGVMNTDNTSIACETIDYGPCAFMDYYDPQTVFSSIDHHGRYAFNNQARIALWNLTRLAESLLPLFDNNQDHAIASAEEVLNTYTTVYTKAWFNGMLLKLGLHQDDAQLAAREACLVDDFLQELQQHSLDYTGAFRSLGNTLNTGNSHPLISENWQHRWKECMQLQGIDMATIAENMHAVNPIYIPRNHIVEEAISAAEDGNYAPFNKLVDILDTPYTEIKGLDKYAQPSPKDAPKYRTFCGT